MGWSLKLFSVRGIPIRVHATFLLILLWAAYSALLNSTGGGAGQALRNIGFMILFVLLLFVCVVLHELGHSLVAQLLGVKVRDITLWPIGGVASMTRMPESAFQEFIISAAGPATNVLVAIILGALAVLLAGPTAMLQLLASPARLLNLLGEISWFALLMLLIVNNILLTVFNLVPAFPLDGGRLMRSVLSGFLPHRVATQVASWVGQGVAAIMVVLGLMGSNVGLALIGVLVFLAAGSERHQAVLDERLRRLSVRQAMRPIGRPLHPLQTLGEVAAESLTSPQTTYAVMEDGRLIGTLSRRELMAGLRVNGPHAPVSRRMEKPVTVGPDDTLYVAQTLMLGEKAPAAFVVEGEEIRGILFPADVGRLVELLEAYPEALSVTDRS